MILLMLVIFSLVLFVISAYYILKHKQEATRLKTIVKDQLNAINCLNEDLDRAYVEARTARADALKRSRAVIKGQVSENLAPMLPDFPYQLTDARFLGNPVDFIVFDGYSDAKNSKTSKMKIVFVEVKSGKSQLTTGERIIRNAIRDKRIEWLEFRVDDEHGEDKKD